ncbi:hypothetical protein H0H93_006496, partial [Arthromyces matolae]
MAIRQGSRMQPARKDSLMLPAVGPARRATLAPPNNERALSVLNNAIQTINIASNL